VVSAPEKEALVHVRYKAGWAPAEKRTFLLLLGLKFQPLGQPARRQLLSLLQNLEVVDEITFLVSLKN
jgi:hypothetical protein